jgi:hypothetical protein
MIKLVCKLYLFNCLPEPYLNFRRIVGSPSEKPLSLTEGGIMKTILPDVRMLSGYSP